MRWILPHPSLVFHKKPTFLASLPRSAWRDDLEITQAAYGAPATVCKFRDERVITRRGGHGLPMVTISRPKPFTWQFATRAETQSVPFRSSRRSSPFHSGSRSFITYIFTFC